MNKRKIEILAPAGNVDSFKAAVNAGANAIYMGLGKHNARTMAQNFTLEEYIECIHYAHIREVKVYLTLNTLVYDEEIEEALELLLKLYEEGLDAVILQDMGLASIIHKLIPNLSMHASTQMSAYSLEQVQFLEKFGFQRVVLARELTIEEIKKITDNSNVEIEVFVHGALCVSLSGQCLLSSTIGIGNRSANRGACAQPCRMKYSLYLNNKEIVKEKYILSKKDIYGLDLVSKFAEVNISSFKIEGRNKSPEYVATVISKYRKYLDNYLIDGQVNVSEEDEKELLQIFNRSGKSEGYLTGVRYRESITPVSPKNTGIYLGEVIDQNKEYIKVKLEEDIDLHDGIEIYSQNGNIASNIITCVRTDKFKIINDIRKKGELAWLGDIKEKVQVGAKIYKTSNSNLNSRISKEFLNKCIRKRSLNLTVTIKEESPVLLSTVINNRMYLYNTNIIPEKSIKSEINLESIEKVFSKTQDTGFEFKKVIGIIEEGLFLKTSVLNEIRRLFISKLEEKCILKRDISKERKILKEILNDFNKSKNIDTNINENTMFVYKYDKNADYSIYYLNKYNKKLQRIDFNMQDYIKNEEDIFNKYSDLKLGVSISNFTLNNMERYIKGNIERLIAKGIKTVILGSTQYLELLKELKTQYDFEIIADYSFNIANKYGALSLIESGFDKITLGIDNNIDSVNEMAKIVPIEVIDNYITVMTSRYCILGSFVEDRVSEKICGMNCRDFNYYIKDSYRELYGILCNNVDCTMSIIRKYNQSKDITKNKNINLRNVYFN